MTDLASPPTADQAPTGPLASRPRGRRAGTVLLVLGVIVVSVLAVWYFTASDETDPPVQTRAVFDFDQDTLCDWFTAGQMEAIVTEAMQRADLDVEVESFATSGECRVMSLARSDAIWDTPGWRSQTDGGLGIVLAPVVNDPRGPGYRSTDPADFERHSVLDDAVSYGNLTDFGFAYSPGVMVQLHVEGHEDEVLFLGVGVEGNTLDQVAGSQQQDFALSVADLMLEQMGWTDRG